MEKIIDALIKVFEVLIGSNPLAAVLFLALAIALIALRRLYGDQKELRCQFDLLLRQGPVEKETAINNQIVKSDQAVSEKNKEIALLHEQYADLSRDTTNVLRGMEAALTSGNPKKLLTSIHNGLMTIGQKAHNLTPSEMGMNSTSE